MSVTAPLTVYCRSATAESCKLKLYLVAFILLRLYNIANANAALMSVSSAGDGKAYGVSGALMTLPASEEIAQLDTEHLKELASIARLITYARQSARELNVEFPVWCLDLALGAVLQEMYSGKDEPTLLDDTIQALGLAPRH